MKNDHRWPHSSNLKSKEPIYCKLSRKACYMSDIWERSLKMCQAQESIWAAKHAQRKTNTKSDQIHEYSLSLWACLHCCLK